jgi:hypothetical protein
MMQMLAAGGMRVLTDGARAADEDNPRGYFEFEPVKRTKQDGRWVTEAVGKAVKMVYLLVKDLPAHQEFRVILMQRDLGEVLASQRTMLERRGQAGSGLSDDRMAAIFGQQMRSIAAWLRGQPNFRVLEVQHRACLETPGKVARQVNEFLASGLDEAAMAGVVDPALYRRSFLKRSN